MLAADAAKLEELSLVQIAVSSALIVEAAAELGFNAALDVAATHALELATVTATLSAAALAAAAASLAISLTSKAAITSAAAAAAAANAGSTLSNVAFSFKQKS